MTEETKREQTLLEAAKAILEIQDRPLPSYRWLDLRAAISREEARPPATTDGERRCWEGLVEQWRKGHDEQAARAQQAEADAKWHREESARLSAELAKERERADRSEKRYGQLRSAIDRDRPVKEMRERAEKAEAELAESCKESADHAWQISTLEGQMRTWKARAEEAEAALAKPQQSHPMDGGEITVMLNRAGVRSIDSDLAPLANSKRIEWLIGEWKAERTLKESFRRDSRDVRNDMHAWNRRLGEVVPVADNPIDTVRAVIDEVHRLRTKVDLAKEALGGKS